MENQTVLDIYTYIRLYSEIKTNMQVSELKTNSPV